MGKKWENIMKEDGNKKKKESLNKALKSCVKDINNDLRQITWAEDDLIERYILCGISCIELKEALKKMENDHFTSFVEEHIPYSSIRSLQRCMKLAKHTNMEFNDHPLLLGETLLLALINLIGENELVDDYLKNNDIDFDFDYDDMDSIHKFKEKVQKLIDNKSVKSKISADKTLSNLKKTLQTYLTKVESYSHDSSEISETDVLQDNIGEAEKLVEALKALKALQKRADYNDDEE